jgi:chromosome segregation ATPase
MKTLLINYLNHQLSINQRYLIKIESELASNKLLLLSLNQEVDHYFNLLTHLNNQLTILNSYPEDFRAEVIHLFKEKISITQLQLKTKQQEVIQIQNLITNHPNKLQTIKSNINYYTNYISICNSDVSNFKDY